MEGKISILKCPNCGSTEKTDLKPGLFQCLNCKTTYYLENEDTEVKSIEDRAKTPELSTHSDSRLLILIAVLALLAISVFLYLRVNRHKAPEVSASAYPVEKQKTAEYNSGNLGALELVSPVTQKPIIIRVESRTYNNAKIGPTTETKFLIFYDPLENKVIKEVKLAPITGFTQFTQLRTFSNNRTYLISSKDVYELDTESMELRLANSTLFAAIIKGGSGLKSVKFTEDGDGFELVTSEDELIYYFPGIDKTYSAESYDKAAHGFATLLPVAMEMTYHQFTESKNKYSDNKLQLLKIKYMDNGAGPKTFQKFFIWSRSYVVGSGYVICLVIPDLKEYRRIKSHTDLTPGRNYYDPMVVYEDKETLLIRFRANAEETSPYKLQRLDRNSGAVIWTAALVQGGKIEKLYRYKNGYYAFAGDGVTLFDLDGVRIDNFKN